MKKLDSGFNWINLDQFERCWHKHTMTGKNGNWKTSRIICGDMSRETATRWRGPETWQQWSRKISREGVKLLLGNSNQGKHEGKRTAGKCVYCGNEHRSSSCTKVLSVANRREILKKNKRCYNCTGMGHSAANCRSKNCIKCGRKHHTSLCEKVLSSIPEKSHEKNYCVPNSSAKTIHATVNAKLNRQKVRIVIDTGVPT